MRGERGREHDDPARGLADSEVERPPHDADDAELQPGTLRRLLRAALEGPGDLLLGEADCVERAADPEPALRGEPFADGDLERRVRVGLAPGDQPRPVDDPAHPVVERRGDREVVAVQAVGYQRVAAEDDEPAHAGTAAELVELLLGRAPDRDLDVGAAG